MTRSTGRGGPSSSRESHESGPSSSARSYSGEYTQRIIRAFSHSLQEENINIRSLSRQELTYYFKDFVQRNYDNKILEALYDGRVTGEVLDIALAQITQSGPQLGDFAQTNKAELLREQFARSRSEQDAILSGLSSLRATLQSTLTTSQWNTIKVDDFLHDEGFIVSGSGSGEVISSSGSIDTHDIDSLARKRNAYVDSKTRDTVLGNHSKSSLHFDDFDRSEKIITMTMVEKLQKTLARVSGADKKQRLQDYFDSIFHYNADFVPAATPWISIDGLTRHLDQFFEKAQTVLPHDEYENLLQISVRLQDCKEKSDHYYSDSASHSAIHYSQLDSSLKSLANSIVQYHLTDHIDHITQQVDHTAAQYSEIFDIPSNLADFFHQFMDSQHGSEIPQNRDSLFRKLQHTVEHKSREIGITIDTDTLFEALTELQSSQRNVSRLDALHQAVLMRSSLIMQLHKLKGRQSFDVLEYEFDSYAQFIISLYDFSSNKATLTTKDGVEIDLPFVENSKKFVGKPLEFADISINDIDQLSSIRIEFQIDLTDNPKAERLLQVLTQQSAHPLIYKFFNKTEFPETITESSLLELTDKDGNTYQGYLSPTELVAQHSDIEGMDDLLQSKSFFLYSKPADQLHTERDMIRQKDNHGNEITDRPVMINYANLSQRRSIRLKGPKIVTLAADQLSALTLGHLALQGLTEQELFDEGVDIERRLEGADQILTDKLLHSDPRDIAKDEGTQQEIQKPLTTAEEFQQSRKKIVGDYPCEVGARIAVKFPTTLDGKPTLASFPHSEQLLSMTIVSLQRNEKGEAQEATFRFDTLSRIGSISMPYISLKGKQLNKITDVFLGGATYVDNIKTDNQTDYRTVIERLQKRFSDGVRQKTYIRDTLSSLDFDGSHFLKDGQKVDRFVSVTKTSDASSSSSKQFDVEYTVESLGGGKYKVSSTPYSAELVDKNGAIKKENIQFETITDLSGLALVLANKGLVPYTKSEYEDYKSQQGAEADDIPKLKGRLTLGTLFNYIIKGKGKEVRESLKKQIKEKSEEDATILLLMQGKLMDRLSGSWLGKTLDRFDVNPFGGMALDIQKQAQEFGWKKINGVLDYLNSFHKSYNAYGPSGMAQVGDMLRGIKSKGSLNMRDRRTTAAILLYTMDKMGSAYANGIAKPGDYVKILFGKAYYAKFIEHQKRLQYESHAWTADGKSAQDRLAMLEYNFILSNTRGNDLLEKKDPYLVNGTPNPFYFQDLYSREFGNKVAESINKVKNFNPDTNKESVKAIIALNNFDHTYNECKDHIVTLRTGEFVDELTALTLAAKNPTQLDQVVQLFMLGILSGAFNNNISFGDRSKLKNIMYRMGVPYAGLIEKTDGPEKLQQLLTLASGAGSGSFESFHYNSSLRGKTTYNAHHFGYGQEADRRALANSFQEWFDRYHFQVIPFLHMDPSSMKTPDNIIRVWKSEPAESVTIFGRAVNKEDKILVNSLMEEFYHQSYGRSISVDESNDNGELVHTASMIDEFFPMINRQQDGMRDPSIKSHAELTWSNIKNNAPSGGESSDNDYLLAWHINEFFRYFNGIGGFKYNRTTIESFYRHVLLAQQQPSRSEQIRLFRFFLTNMLYSNGPVPDEVKESFAAYMKYFEQNISHFTPGLGKFHQVPGSSDKTFEYVFEEKSSTMTYIPQHVWRRIVRDRQQNEYNRRARIHNTTILNEQMDRENTERRTGSAGFYSNNSGKGLGKSVDDLIKELRGSSSSENSHQEAVRAIPIDARNASQAKIVSLSGDGSGWWKGVKSELDEKSRNKNNSSHKSSSADLQSQLDDLKNDLGLTA